LFCKESRARRLKSSFFGKSEKSCKKALEKRARVWYNKLIEKLRRKRRFWGNCEMYSMTGFGKGEYRENGFTLTVELKSVNNRFLDISVKCPHVLFAYEDAVREILRASVSRGHVDVFIGISDKREKPKSVYLDVALAEAYVNAAKSLKERFPEIGNDVTTSYLLRAPDVLRFDESEGEDPLLLPALRQAIGQAAQALKTMRFAEGERLKRDVLARMETISALREKIAARAPLVTEEYRARLTERMNEYLDGKVDESRILTEAAIFADKCNIDEELTRLNSHIAEFAQICECDTVGRKLDFLVQEFNRECNTICSKSNDAAITAAALEMKNEIEKVREQIQNLE